MIDKVQRGMNEVPTSLTLVSQVTAIQNIMHNIKMIDNYMPGFTARRLPLGFALIALLLACLPIATRAGTPVTLDSLLNEMVDVESIARWPAQEFTCKQASSYDRKKVAPDKPGWFANHDNTEYIRTEETDGRKENVMMDADGPGSIVRFWLTVGGPKDGTMRIYLDGDKMPAMTFTEFSLLTGDLHVDAPLAQAHPGKRGNNLYLPIPYAKHCKVTWEEKSKGGARYYHINYRTYTAGTEVKSFALPQVEASKSLIDQVNQALTSPTQSAAGKTATLQQELKAGTQASLNLPAGSNAIRDLELSLKTDNPKEVDRTLRGIIIQLTFDGEVTAWCPATDFFGTAVGINEVRNWYRTVNKDGTMKCRWVMPYAKSAKITLLNVGSQPVTAALQAITSPWKWDQRSMYFHTAWHHEAGLKTPPLRDWNFITIKGRGVYVGDTLTLFNPVPTWYGEGDEKIWVDGEAFPSHLGTGTEDYYNYSYAPKPVHNTPFSNLVREDDKMTMGWNVMSRTRNLDGIPFRQSLQFDIELISWKPTTMIYEATTHWYAFPNVTTNVAPQAKEAAQSVLTNEQMQPINEAVNSCKPGAIECETMKVIRKSDRLNTSTQNMENFGSRIWSSGAQLLAKGTRVGDFIELEIPASDTNPKQISLYVTQAVDFGILTFSVNGQSCPTPFDCYAPKVMLSEPVMLGVFSPKAGKFVLRAEVTGTNPAAKGARYFFGLDCVILNAMP